MTASSGGPSAVVGAGNRFASCAAMTLAIATARSRSPLPCTSAVRTPLGPVADRMGTATAASWSVGGAAGRGRRGPERRRRQVVHRQRERPEAREHLGVVSVGHGRDQFLPILGEEPHHHAAGVQHRRRRVRATGSAPRRPRRGPGPGTAPRGPGTSGVVEGAAGRRPRVPRFGHHRRGRRFAQGQAVQVRPRLGGRGGCGDRFLRLGPPAAAVRGTGTSRINATIHAAISAPGQQRLLVGHAAFARRARHGPSPGARPTARARRRRPCRGRR